MERKTRQVNRTARLLVRLTTGLILLTAMATSASGSLVAGAKGSITKNQKNPYFASGKMIVNAPLTTKTPGWQLDDNCVFENGAYHVVRANGGLVTCHSDLQLSDFTLEAQMQITQGECVAIAFRDIPSEQQSYIFQPCKATYEFIRQTRTSENGSVCETLKSGKNPAMHAGFNLIAVVANGSTFDLYVNHQKVTTIHDSKYSQGQVGFQGYEGDEVVKNAKIWQLSGGPPPPPPANIE